MKALAKRLLRRLTYRLGYQNLDHLSLLLYSRLQKVDEFFIVQIGANDGVTYDPIHDFVVRNRSKIAGIMLEPLPDFFHQLEQTYREFPRLRLLQLAVHATEKSMKLFRVDPRRLASMSEHFKGIASFDRSYFAKSNTPPEAIVAETVPCISMRELIESQNVRKIDLLCIDTEGYDAEIILDFPFAAMRPTIIMFEHGLRDAVMAGAVFFEVINLLNRYEYDVMVQDYDVVAHLRDRLAS